MLCFEKSVGRPSDSGILLLGISDIVLGISYIVLRISYCVMGVVSEFMRSCRSNLYGRLMISWVAFGSVGWIEKRFWYVFEIYCVICPWFIIVCSGAFINVIICFFLFCFLYFVEVGVWDFVFFWSWFSASYSCPYVVLVLNFFLG